MRDFDKTHSKSAGDISILLENALKFHQDNDLSQAEALFNTVLIIDSTNFISLHQIGVIKNQCGDFENGMKFLNKAIKLHPRSALAHLNVGISLFNLNRLEESLAHFGYSLTIQPDNTDALINRAIAFNRLGRVAKAEADLRKALGLRSDDQTVLGMLAHLSGEAGRVFDALVDFRELCRRAIAASPEGLVPDRR